MSAKNITSSEHMQLIGLFAIHRDLLRRLEDAERAIARIVEPEKADFAEWNMADTLTQDELWTTGGNVVHLLHRLEINVTGPVGD